MKDNEVQKLKKNIGNKIKFFRKRKGLSQLELAELVNIEMKSLSRIESGHNYPQCENLVAIANALSVDPWQLYFCESKMNTEKMKQELLKAIDTDEKLISTLYSQLILYKTV